MAGADVTDIRDLYEVSHGAATFSLYIFYLDDSSHAAGVVASLSPIRPKSDTASAVASTSAPRTAFTSAPHAASTPAPRAVKLEVSEVDPAPVQTYLQKASAEHQKLALCRAIGSSDLGHAYKMYAFTWLLPSVWVELGGGAWPKTGLPKAFKILDSQFFEVVLAVDHLHLLSYCGASAGSTFTNHMNWYHSTLGAIDLLQTATATHQITPEDPMITSGAYLYALAYGPILQPDSAGNFIIPKHYHKIVTFSIAETKKWSTAIKRRFDPAPE
ncbi:hypothetical protein DFH09DRAFT_1328058 [Mycena vulgaris]|nr:hypothetical protein DFH09DRAFT_1328058 [Mycena vulgaris]